MIMNTELVRLTTQDVNKGQVICSSRDVAESFKKRHSDVIRAIENTLKALENTDNAIVGSIKIIQSEYKIDNIPYKEYLLDRDAFTLIAMGFTGKEAIRWKLKYIQAFNTMEQELLARQETRLIGKQVRHSLTDSIKDNVSGEGNFKKFAYSNYSKLVYKKVLGKQVKKLKEDRGLTERDNLRDYLTLEELERVQALESKIAAYIEMRSTGTTDKEVYSEVKEYVDSI